MAQYKKNNTVQIRRYTRDSIHKLYDQMKPQALPDDVQNTIKHIQNELSEIKTDAEIRNQRRHRSLKRHSAQRALNKSQVSPIMINRSKIEPVDEFISFQKKSNLILNSLIDSNIDDVAGRLVRLLKQQKELLVVNQDTVAKYGNHVCSQIVENATIQSMYSSAYVNVVKQCIDSLQEPPHVELGQWIRKHVARLVLHVEPSHVTKLSAKGNAKLTTYLYIENLVSRVEFHEYIQYWLTHLQENEQHICELLVHLFLTLSESQTHKTEWLSFVKQTIQPLWEDTSAIGIRARIRLWDIRDAYMS